MSGNGNRMKAISRNLRSAEGASFRGDWNLAEAFGTTRGNVSHAVSSLEAKGFVQRQIDPEDARSYLLTLKPSGKKCAVRVIGAFDKMQRSFERQVGKENLDKAIRIIRTLH